MSGGSLDYAYSKVNYIADEVERQATTALQKAFVKHLRDVGEALHDLEWVGSGDYGVGDEVEVLRKVVSKETEIEAATEQAHIALKQLQEVLCLGDST